MFSLARALHRSGYKTAVLSNTEAPSVEYFRQQDYDMFDTVIFSCEERMKKPELRIYQTAASRLAVPPEQIVFIDDRQEHIDGAKKAGLNAILFENYQQVIRALSDLSVKVTARLY